MLGGSSAGFCDFTNPSKKDTAIPRAIQSHSTCVNSQALGSFCYPVKLYYTKKNRTYILMVIRAVTGGKYFWPRL